MTSENTPVDLTAFVKTYDVRGLVGSQLTDEVVEAFGAAFADEIEGAGRDLVVGHDMRDSSPGFAEAFARGARARGADVVALGLCSTDESYFARLARRPGGHVHREPQSGHLQRHQDEPGRRPGHQPRHGTVLDP